MGPLGAELSPNRPTAVRLRSIELRSGDLVAKRAALTTRPFAAWADRLAFIEGQAAVAELDGDLRVVDDTRPRHARSGRTGSGAGPRRLTGAVRK